jgi:hypothetical protein
VLDGFGGLHPFALGSNPVPHALAGTPSWRGFDIARGVVLLTETSGYVLDGFGGVHTFGGAPPPRGAASWRGFAIARALTLTVNGYAGAVLDGFGGVHLFGVGGGAPAIRSLDIPYARGLDVYRGLALLESGV